MKPTIVLVHGGFADSAIWNGVIDILLDAEQRVVAVANPLRGLAGDVQAVTDVVRSLDGPVVLVGHAYGGAVITYVEAENVVGLVYVAAIAPAPGESALALAGSRLAGTLEPVARADGTTDLTIAEDRFHEQFAADLPAAEAARMAATQRPIAREALLDAGGPDPLWKRLPSWFIYGEGDRTIPAAMQAHMADRAVAQRAVEILRASHAIAVSCPDAVAGVILQAASEPAVV